MCRPVGGYEGRRGGGGGGGREEMERVESEASGMTHVDGEEREK